MDDEYLDYVPDDYKIECNSCGVSWVRIKFRFCKKSYCKSCSVGNYCKDHYNKIPDGYMKNN